MMDRKKFYSHLRSNKSTLFGSRLSDGQVKGMEGILDAFEWYGDASQKTLAYALATAYHEVGRGMMPVREGFKKSDAAARKVVAHRKYGKPMGPYGHVYYGRGLPQLTWMRNYRITGQQIGIDLVKYPDRMLEPIVSARVLIEGLIDGRWNGHKKGIGHYLPVTGKDDLKNARRTVNITDKWSLIAGYYRQFMAALDAAEFGKDMEKAIAKVIAPPSVVPLPEPVPILPSKPKGWLGVLFILLGNLFKGRVS